MVYRSWSICLSVCLSVRPTVLHYHDISRTDHLKIEIYLFIGTLMLSKTLEENPIQRSVNFLTETFIFTKMALTFLFFKFTILFPCLPEGSGQKCFSIFKIPNYIHLRYLNIFGFVHGSVALPG